MFGDGQVQEVRKKLWFLWRSTPEWDWTLRRMAVTSVQPNKADSVCAPKCEQVHTRIPAVMVKLPLIKWSEFATEIVILCQCVYILVLSIKCSKAYYPDEVYLLVQSICLEHVKLVQSFFSWRRITLAKAEVFMPKLWRVGSSDYIDYTMRFRGTVLEILFIIHVSSRILNVPFDMFNGLLFLLAPSTSNPWES